MFKKIASVLLIVMLVLSMTVVAVSAEQVEIVDGAAAEAVADQGADAGAAESGANTISFDVSSAGWNNVSQIFCHIWAVDGTGEWPSWQSKKEKCTDNGDGTWSYDLSKCGNDITESGSAYAVIFSADTGMQTYDLLMGSPCIGDTAYCNGETCENPADSTKTCQITVWKGQDQKTFGPELQVTSIGNIVGTCIPSSKSAYGIMVDFLTNNLENARTYSGKDDQAIVDDAAKALGLKKGDVESAIKEAGVTVSWDKSKSSLDDGTNDEAHKKGDGTDDGSGSGSSDSDSGSSGSSSSSSSGSGSSSSSGSSKSGSASASTTGQDSTVLFIMLGVMALAAGVIIIMRKRSKV